MTRVAYVCADPGIPVYGRKGASVHVQEVVRALRGRGATVELFATRVDGGEAGGVPPDLADVPVHLLPTVGKGDPAIRERRAVAANAGLRQALELRGPFDLVYERYSLWSFAGMSYATAHGIPGMLEVNAPLVDEQARHRNLVDRTSAEQLARIVFGLAGAIVAVSDRVGAWAGELSRDPQRVHVVPNGVDPGRFAPGDAGAGDGETFTVGFVGTLKPWHGVGTLVDAVGRLVADDRAGGSFAGGSFGAGVFHGAGGSFGAGVSHGAGGSFGAGVSHGAGGKSGWRLLIVGDGPQRRVLESAVDAVGLSSRTEFTGAVDPAAVPGHLAHMDVAVAPYADVGDDYFSPLKLYEYLAAGLPVIASAVGQVTEAVTDGVTGLLTRPGDAVALAQALEELRRDPVRRAALAAAGREAVVADRTWDAVAGRVLALADACRADACRRGAAGSVPAGVA